jgi:hypothetical protein
VNITSESIAASIDHTATYSPSLWNAEFVHRAGHSPTYQAAGVMATFYMLHIGIVRSNSTAPVDILHVTHRNSIDHIDFSLVSSLCVIMVCNIVNSRVI